ncbi:NAD-dependent epimerase/dehydratase family protein [Formosa haliotis]|uniref:NAD-dependent epimerase/dehydratase family protein n=1 Tax=Formosa haliotis TaxID=1555194 RepID=UPI0008252A17|nr:NAD(P)-dependent oxidoreductase [Formosa haliotis]
MVVGTGLIANAFVREYKNSKDVVIFASGVSNSNETRLSEFQREKRLLENSLKDYPNALFVYFSTYSLGDPDSINKPYVLHKIEMEHLVNRHRKFLILRVSNVVGHNGNPNTIFNFFVHKLKANELITVWNSAKRNLIDIEDLGAITIHLIKNKVINKILLVTNPNTLYVKDIVLKIANFKQITPKIQIVDRGVDFETEPSNEVINCIKELNLNFNQDYLIRLLKKYY